MSYRSTQMDKERVARRAERQFGRISRAQLHEIGVSHATVSAWIKAAYLHRELPHVYAVGHKSRTTESELAAALLYAGPGALLSHATAAWWLGLLDEQPNRIQVTTPRKCRSLKSIRVYDRRQRTRIEHKGLPLTSVPEVFVDLAGTARFDITRRVLASAEYRELLNLQEIEAILTSGLRGVAKLRRALRRHQPRLAATKSRLERLIIAICEDEGLPLPEINVRVGRWEVDALWREAKLAVELDGYGNHHTRAQLERDRRKDMGLRQLGLTPVRYSEDQLKERTQVAAELRQATT